MIVVYKKVGNDLRLYIVVEHKDYEGKAAVRLVNWIQNLSDSEFTELDLGSLSDDSETQPRSVSPGEKRQLDNVVYDLIAADGFYILKPAVEKNDWSSFFEWLASDLPGIDPEAVFAAYGGVKKLQIFILDNVERFGKEEEYRNA